MSVTITHTPGTTEPGEIRKYHVAITDGTWADFADILEEGVDGQRVWVTINDDVVLKFETARERLGWSDGFRQGVRSATEETVIIDWLEQWLKKDMQKDEMEQEAAARGGGQCRRRAIGVDAGETGQVRHGRLNLTEPNHEATVDGIGPAVSGDIRSARPS